MLPLSVNISILPLFNKLISLVSNTLPNINPLFSCKDIVLPTCKVFLLLAVFITTLLLPALLLSKLNCPPDKISGKTAVKVCSSNQPILLSIVDFFTICPAVPKLPFIPIPSPTIFISSTSKVSSPVIVLLPLDILLLIIYIVIYRYKKIYDILQ